MQRQVCWVQKLEDGVKREVRVTVQRGVIKWQFKRSDAERWDYDAVPTADEWDDLLQRVENRAQRRTATYEDLEMVRRCHARATVG